MHFAQNLRQNQRDILCNPANPVRPKPNPRPEQTPPADLSKTTQHNRVPKSNGKRPRHRNDSWEERVGMGAVGAEESFIVKETQKIRRDYLRELMHNEVAKNGHKFRGRFLGRHKVSSEVRVRMVSDLNFSNLRWTG